jgi:hypothetical protein
MKKIFLLTILLTAALQVKPLVSASNADEQYIPIAIVVPKQAEPFDEMQLTRIGAKMLTIATSSGMSASGSGSPIAMLPMFTIEKEDVVEGGMKNVHAINADITFVIKNMETNVIYSSVSKHVIGSGLSRDRALTDCISKISLSKEEFDSFVDRAREKILDYYRANCPSLIATAETCGKTKQFDQAFAILASIPMSAACYSQTLALIERYYPEYQKLHCQSILHQANTLWGGHKYQQALTRLYDLKVIDTECNKEVAELIKTIESRLTENELREWRLIEEQMRSKVYLEAKRLEAIQAIGMAWYGQKIYQNYTYIVD